MSWGDRSLPAGSSIQTRRHTMALPQGLTICLPVRRLVFGTPAALASTGVLQLRLVNVAGFMDLGAALSHDEFLRACNITSCTEATTDCVVNSSVIHHYFMSSDTTGTTGYCVGYRILFYRKYISRHCCIFCRFAFCKISLSDVSFHLYFCFGILFPCHANI